MRRFGHFNRLGNKSFKMKRRLESAVTDNIRRHVLRILKQHGYPPDLDSEATKLVLEQAGALWAGWPR
ncbi:hypothetical protein EC9_51540 [Rosistilla ulvae]|uniref:Type I restriction enzyme HindI endonuclease subunit-like C-terminal domain-containing protein n=2 Tax=Rosistilla ulvae TaxID=1930277 RepID=A0A517M7S9_9BACT|nr:hypothetical protein EC9_51540 [Rosistilla ulvae]